jgi:uncharacterized protein YcsI (UPF0317 family)
MGIVQGEGFYFLAFFVEKKITTGFLFRHRRISLRLRDINTEVKHDSISFLLGCGFKQVSSLHGSNFI